MMIDRMRCGLDDENIRTTNVFLDLDAALTVLPQPNFGPPKRHLELIGNRLGQGGMRVPGEDLQPTIHRFGYPFDSPGSAESVRLP